MAMINSPLQIIIFHVRCCWDFILGAYKIYTSLICSRFRIFIVCRERKRERERKRVCVVEREKGRKKYEMCLEEGGRERERGGEEGRGKEILGERKREREREREREGEMKKRGGREKARKTDKVCRRKRGKKRKGVTL
jgi:hypothetical protein